MMSAKCGIDNVPPYCLDGGEEEFAALVLEVHDRLVSEKGFNPIVCDACREEMRERVVSVISSSFSTYFGLRPEDRYGDLFDQVADFAERLSKGHIFPDGNKRTTVVFALAVLHISGVILDIEDSEEPDGNEIYCWIQDVVTGDRTKSELAQDLRSRASCEQSK